MLVSMFSKGFIYCALSNISMENCLDNKYCLTYIFLQEIPN